MGNSLDATLTIEDDHGAEPGCSVANTCKSDSCPDHSMCHDTWGKSECACQPGQWTAAGRPVLETAAEISTNMTPLSLLEP